MVRRQLDIEPWRDAMLVASNDFDDSMGGPASELDAATNCRRTLYGKVGRDEQNDMLRLYDFPPPTSHSPARDRTTTPLQQLFVLNSDFVEARARSIVSELLRSSANEPTKDVIKRTYQRLFQRNPSEDELQVGERFLTTIRDQSSTDRWRLYVQSLLGLNEMMFVD
jgi:hypothetical protein